AVVVVGLDHYAVLGDAGDLTVEVVAVINRIREPGDRFRLLTDPTESIAYQAQAEQRGSIGSGLVTRGLAKAVVSNGGADRAESGAGSQTMLWVTGNGEGPDAGQEVVVVVAEGHGVGPVDRLTRQSQTCIDGRGNFTSDRPRPTL